MEIKIHNSNVTGTGLFVLELVGGDIYISYKMSVFFLETRLNIQIV